MGDQWHYFVRGQKFGPVSWQRLKELVVLGVVQPTSEVWKEGMADYVAAADVPDLCRNTPSTEHSTTRLDSPAASERGRPAGYDEPPSASAQKGNGPAPKSRKSLLVGVAGVLALVLVGVGVTLYLKQDGKNKASTNTVKEPVREPEDKVIVFAELASNRKATFAVRKEAVEHLGQMGPKAKKAVPHLIKAFMAEELVESGEPQLADAGKELMSLALLTTKLRTSIARTLGQIGPEAIEAVPALTKRLEAWKPPEKTDEASELAYRLGLTLGGGAEQYVTAAEALWKIERKPEKVVPSLAQAANYGEDKAQIKALEILGEIGPEAKAAVPSIMAVLRIRPSGFTVAPPDVRQAATEALKKIDPSAMP